MCGSIRPVGCYTVGTTLTAEVPGTFHPTTPLLERLSQGHTIPTLSEWETFE